MLTETMERRNRGKIRRYTRDFRVAISLAEPEDADIIRFLDQARWGEKARVIRNALRFYWREKGGTNEGL
ncbi:MAG: hypothetical protein RMK65_08015 [Anaerolineae bacterium]|nr:hypothetical protein [Anaerolineae bacterium]